MTERWKLNKNFADEKNTLQLDQGDFNLNKYSELVLNFLTLVKIYKLRFSKYLAVTLEF